MRKPAAEADRVRVGLALGAAFALTLGSAHAQDRTAWSVYVQENPTQCWVTSTPASTVATRDGEDVTASIRRDEAVLFISFWPADGRLAEVSYTGGYPFADGSTVSLQAGETTFELFTEGPMSWAGSPAADARIIAAMRDGSEVVVTAVSSRGTQVADTFSLTGFSAAMDDAQVRCSN
ncbi:invasion associated locus B family protein [Gymnodinialimonas ulvae]|uniref:invasion associated locus B family protein n=1 Tax=Gymnodinialimonas ulvae TaxID=3126504 RepID=UPI0030AC2115